MYVLCRRLTEPHRTRTGRHAWRLSVGARTGPLSILQLTLHVVCSHARGCTAHASIICIGLLSHICLPRRRRFPRGAGLLARWRRAHARASLRRSRASCRALSHSTSRASSQLPHWRESECLQWPLMTSDCLPHWRESRESRRSGRVANSSIGRSRPGWGLQGWQTRRGASRAPSKWLAWLRA